MRGANFFKILFVNCPLFCLRYHAHINVFNIISVLPNKNCGSLSRKTTLEGWKIYSTQSQVLKLRFFFKLIS